MKNKENDFKEEDVAKMKSIIMKILTTDFDNYVLDGNDTVTDIKNKEDEFDKEDVAKMKSIIMKTLTTDFKNYGIAKSAQNNVDDLADALGSLSLGNGDQVTGDVVDFSGNNFTYDDLYAD